MTFNFTATGIGSMPYTDAQQAVALLSDNLQYIPHWPQLPKRGEQEHFVFQYLAPLVNIGLITVEEGKAPYIDTQNDNFTQALTSFYELFLRAESGEVEALRAFAFPKESAAGFYAFKEAVEKDVFENAKFLKGQLSGPLSVALNLTDENRRSVYYNTQLRDVVIKTLALQGRWQAQTLAGLGKQAIIFIDDPSLYALGASTHITITKEEVTQELNEIITALKSEGALVGVHSCANVDWSLLLNTDLDFLSFDAYGYFENLLLYADDITDFLRKGANLAWGIVPTSEAIFEETTETLKIKLENQIEALVQKGVPKELLLMNSLLTPSCGTGTLTPQTAERIYNILSELSVILNK